MGNVIPWSQIHPTIKSEAPFVSVLIIDPDRQLCVSEQIPLDQEILDRPEVAAAEAIAAAQQAAARVASLYRQRLSQAQPGPTVRPGKPRVPVRGQPTPRFRVLEGGVGEARRPTRP
jgi:hypothetical protein